MKKKVEALCDVKKHVADLSDVINNLTKHVHSTTNAMNRSVLNMQSSVPQQQRHFFLKQHAIDSSSAFSYAASVSVASS